MTADELRKRLYAATEFIRTADLLDLQLELLALVWDSAGTDIAFRRLVERMLIAVTDADY
jgi:hypothetical protein